MQSPHKVQIKDTVIKADESLQNQDVARGYDAYDSFTAGKKHGKLLRALRICKYPSNYHI
jgi:hypothetical protein